MGVRFKVRKRWFRQEYWIYDVLRGEWLVCFESRDEAEVLCLKLNRSVRVGEILK